MSEFWDRVDSFRRKLPKKRESMILSLLHYDRMNLVYPDQILMQSLRDFSAESPLESDISIRLLIRSYSVTTEML